VRRSTIRELGRRCKDNLRKTFRGGIAAAPALRAGANRALPSLARPAPWTHAPAA